MPKSERDPVDSAEYVLRRVPNHVQYVNLNLPQSVQSEAFRPNDKDGHGISVFRELFISAQDLAMKSPKEGDYYVVRLAVADLATLSLSVEPDPQVDGLPGHSLVPELKYGAKGDAKNRERELRLELARLASQNVVFHPVQA